MIYRVIKRYTARGAESLVGTYKSIPEAKQAIQTSMADDIALKVNAIYLLGPIINNGIDKEHQEKRKLCSSRI